MARKADNLAVICEPNIKETLKTQLLRNLWDSMFLYRDIFLFLAPFQKFTCPECLFIIKYLIDTL
jgi:hypothetical protein